MAPRQSGRRSRVLIALELAGGKTVSTWGDIGLLAWSVGWTCVGIGLLIAVGATALGMLVSLRATPESALERVRRDGEHIQADLAVPNGWTAFLAVRTARPIIKRVEKWRGRAKKYVPPKYTKVWQQLWDASLDSPIRGTRPEDQAARERAELEWRMGRALTFIEALQKGTDPEAPRPDSGPAVDAELTATVLSARAYVEPRLIIGPGEASPVLGVEYTNETTAALRGCTVMWEELESPTDFGWFRHRLTWDDTGEPEIQIAAGQSRRVELVIRWPGGAVAVVRIPGESGDGRILPEGSYEATLSVVVDGYRVRKERYRFVWAKRDLSIGPSASTPSQPSTPRTEEAPNQ